MLIYIYLLPSSNAEYVFFVHFQSVRRIHNVFVCIGLPKFSSDFIFMRVYFSQHVDNCSSFFWKFYHITEMELYRVQKHLFSNLVWLK